VLSVLTMPLTNANRPVTVIKLALAFFLAVKELMSKKVQFSYLLQQHVHYLNILLQQIAESYLLAH